MVSAGGIALRLRCLALTASAIAGQPSNAVPCPDTGPPRCPCRTRRQPVLLRVGVVTNTRDLPANLDARSTSRDAELVVRYFFADEHAHELPDACELVSELAVESFEPVRKLDLGLTLVIQNCRAAVDIHHIRRFDKRMLKVLVLGV